MNIENFLQFVKDYGEVILALIAIGITLIIYSLTKKKKQLEYQVISDYNVFDINDKFKNDIEITYQKQTVENLRFFVIKFKNTGNVPITKNDFSKPISIVLQDDDKLVNCDIINTTPTSLEIELMPFNKEAKNISIEPCLINQKDAFEISILTISTNSNSNFDVRGRIAGVREITKSKDVDYTFWDHPLTFLLLVGFSFPISIIFGTILIDYLTEFFGVFGGILSLISSFGIIFFSIFLVLKYSSPTTKERRRKNQRRR